MRTATNDVAVFNKARIDNVMMTRMRKKLLVRLLNAHRKIDERVKVDIKNDQIALINEIEIFEFLILI